MVRCRLSSVVFSSAMSLPTIPYEAPVSARRAYTPRPLPSTSSCAWMPLHEIQQTWARFASEVEDASAYSVIGFAFQALSWEASALRHHHGAAMDEQRGMAPSATSWLEEALQCLCEASHQWGRVFSWLDRYANQDTLDPDALEAVRPLCTQAIDQQHRLATLIQAVQADLFAWRHLCREGDAQQEPQAAHPEVRA